MPKISGDVLRALTPEMQIGYDKNVNEIYPTSKIKIGKHLCTIYEIDMYDNSVLILEDIETHEKITAKKQFCLVVKDE